MKFNNLMNNFTSGEWSPKMAKRSDAEQYFKACERMENFLPKIYGGAFRRPGTVRAVLASANITKMQNALGIGADLGVVKSKMIPFVLSNGDKYILTCVDGLPSTKWYIFDPEDLAATPLVIATNSFTDLSCSAASIKYTQVGDFLFLVDGAGLVAPRILWLNTATGDFTLSMTFQMPSIAAFKYWEGVPFLPINANESGPVLTPSGTTGAITIGSSTSFFDAGHVNALFKFNASGSTGLVFITGVTSPVLASGTVVGATSVAASPHGGAAAGTSWEEAAWSDYRGYPRTVTAFESRVIFGGSPSFPDTLWGSRANNVLAYMERPFEQEDLFTGYTEDNSRPFTLTPNSKEASNIRALSSDKTLLIHTDRSEIVGYGTQGALGPNDFNFPSSTSFGASTPMPTRLNSYAVFVQKGGTKLRDVSFNFDQDQYKSTDLSFVADHLTKNENYNYAIDRIVEICSATSDSSYLYAKTQDGRLLCLVLDRDYQINAWCRITLGGVSIDPGVTHEEFPCVKSMCAIEGPNGEGDRVFLMVQRYINGADVMQLEYFDVPNDEASIDLDISLANGQAAYACMDHKSRYVKGNATYSLSHLVGQTVQVIANGQYLGTKVVDSSGEIDIPTKYTSTDHVVIVGLPCSALLKTLGIAIGNQIPNTAQGSVSRVDEMVISFYETYGAKYGHDENNMHHIDFKDPAAAMNAPVEFYTGDKVVKFATDYTRRAQIIVSTDSPWPCNVLCVTAKGQLYD